MCALTACDVANKLLDGLVCARMTATTRHGSSGLLGMGEAFDDLTEIPAHIGKIPSNFLWWAE